MQRLLGLLLMLTGCFTTRVETMSQPTTVHLRLSRVCSGTSLEASDDHANFKNVAITDDKAEIAVPSMRGGYSERGGHTSNVSDPADYGAVRLLDGNRVVTELSLNGIAALPKDVDGRAVVPVTCGS